MVSVILKKICIIFSYNGIIISVSVILKKIKFTLFLFICIFAILPKDTVPIVPKSVITSISLKLQRLSIIPE